MENAQKSYNWDIIRSIVFRKGSFINAKKVLNFIATKSYKWGESNKVPKGVPYKFPLTRDNYS